MTAPLAEISTELLLVIFLISLVVVPVLISLVYSGSGADLLDWPSRSNEQRLRADEDDLRQMVETENRHRRREGLSEVSEEEIRLRGVDALGEDPR